FVSRHHAQIVSDRTGSFVEDMNSTNGIFIRSQRVKRHDLTDGDVIQLGEHKLLYRDQRHLRPVVAEDYDELEDDVPEERAIDTDDTDARGAAVHARDEDDDADEREDDSDDRDDREDHDDDGEDAD